MVFIPSNLEQPKQVNSAVYTDRLVAVDGNYDDVNKLASEIAGEEEGWAFVNVNVRPFYAEGSKTLGYEIAEQLGWRLPDQIVIPVASGSQLTKVDKAFQELITLGLVEDKPYKVFGAQATGCSPVSVAYKAGTDAIRPVKPDTIAKSLAIGNPADGIYVLDICRRSGGAVEDITDDEVREAHRAAGPHRGDLHRDRRRHHRRRAEEARRDRPARHLARDRRHQHRPRPQDPRRRLRPGRRRRHHRPVLRRLRRRRHRLSAARTHHEESPMSVSVRIPTILRTYTGGESEVSAEGDTLAAVLDDLDASYAGIKGRILDEAGNLRRFVNVYVGNDDVRFLDDLATATPDGTQISVIPAVAGG